MNDASYRERNDTARARLTALVRRLTKEDLDQPLGDGWTVKAALAHLAFWDRFATATIDQWRRFGFAPSAEDDGTVINAAALQDWLTLSPASTSSKSKARLA